MLSDWSSRYITVTPVADLLELHFRQGQHHQHQHQRAKAEREQPAVRAQPRQAAERDRPQDRQQDQREEPLRLIETEISIQTSAQLLANKSKREEPRIEHG